jgi:phage-related protein
MSTFTYSPKYGAAFTKSPKVRIAAFGDGYQQRVADGINTTPRGWSLSFEGTKTEIDAIELFLATENGVTSFDWQPPTGSAGKWICSQWSNSIIEYDHWSLTANFQEVFGE